MICPYCDNDNDSRITVAGFLIYNCSKCDGVYHAPVNKKYKSTIGTIESMTVGTPWYNKHKVILPELVLGDSVMCVDNKHPLFLNDGFVRELDHLHARILFKGNKLIWMNNNIIAKMPG
jgi:hypothetical protein